MNSAAVNMGVHLSITGFYLHTHTHTQMSSINGSCDGSTFKFGENLYTNFCSGYRSFPCSPNTCFFFYVCGVDCLVFLDNSHSDNGEMTFRAVSIFISLMDKNVDYFSHIYWPFVLFI